MRKQGFEPQIGTTVTLMVGTVFNTVLERIKTLTQSDQNTLGKTQVPQEPVRGSYDQDAASSEDVANAEHAVAGPVKPASSNPLVVNVAGIDVLSLGLMKLALGLKPAKARLGITPGMPEQAGPGFDPGSTPSNPEQAAGPEGDGLSLGLMMLALARGARKGGAGTTAVQPGKAASVAAPASAGSKKIESTAQLGSSQNPLPASPGNSQARPPSLKDKVNDAAEKLGRKLDYAETGYEIFKTYRSDQTPEEKAESYGESAGSLIGSRAGEAIGARLGPIGAVLGERLGGRLGESLGGQVGKLLGASFMDEPIASAPANSSKVPLAPVSLLRAEATNTPKAELMPVLARLLGLSSPTASPGPLLSPSHGEPASQSLMGWMTKNWFVPVACKPSPPSEGQCTPCPGDQGKGGHSTTAPAPDGSRPPRMESSGSIALGGTAVVGALPAFKATLTQPPKDPLPRPSVPGIASRMWSGVKAVARLAVLGAGIKALSTARYAQSAEQKAEGYAGAAGGLAGALAGAALGAPVPVVGPVIGALLGGLYGDQLGSALAKSWFAPEAETDQGRSAPRSADSDDRPSDQPERNLGRAVRAMELTASEPVAIASVPGAGQAGAAQPPQLVQQITFAPTISVQGGISDPLQLAQQVGAIVRREFDELMRQSTSRQLYDVPHVA
ncbi:hypothetical protein [Pseudomonas vranovensis]|nr:hypothetical protein [Pseudomonas vranovensis]